MPQRRRTRKEQEGKNIKRRSREFSFKYKFNVEDKKIEVCQMMFLNTLGISKKVIVNIFQNKISKEGVLKKDSRGRRKGTKFISDRESVVMEHIKLFKCVESHYVRKTSKFQYLPQNLTLAEMYRMFQKWCSDEGEKQENYDFYRRIFITRFKLKFQKPKKDVCSTCSAYNNKAQKTEDDDIMQKKHLDDKETARSIKSERKNEAKGDDSITCAAFDLQQVLLSPYGQTSDFFYSRRLKNFNLTVTELDSMKTYCNLWHEGEGNKGSCEIGTAVLKFLAEKKKEGNERVYFFSDACGGQNRNRFIFIMLSYAMRVYNFEYVDITFLVSGHSQNENDTAHSVIEGHTKKLTIYTPSQWETNIQNSFQKNECNVYVLSHNDFINFKSKEFFAEYNLVLTDKATVDVEVSPPPKAPKTRFHISNFVKGKKKTKKIMWSKIVEARFVQSNPTKIYFKYDYNEEFFIADFCTHTSVLKKKKTGWRLYEKPVGVCKKKREDLIKLCTKNLIPEQHKAFYRELPANGKDDDEYCNVKEIVKGGQRKQKK